MLRLLVMVSLVAVPAFAEDDCTLSEDAIRPQLDAKKLPKGARLTEQRRHDRVHRETLVFADGLEATLQVGGCAHIGLSVALSSKKSVTAKLTPSQAVALMKKVLPMLPLAETATLQPKIFLDALDAAKTVPATFPVPLPCGDATCELSLELAGTKKTLIIAYDFAL
ncbi:MAG: hypothetical protein Q8L14_11725 [Myxococcales bacterium]|nr:hypothetical protein [Myxococcales bacterium]